MTDGVDEAMRKAAEELRLLCELERRKHKLAARYLGLRHFWVLFLPSLILTTGAGLLSFISTSDVAASKDKDSEDGLSDSVQNVYGMVVGLISLISAALQTLVDYLKWKSRADMHRSASLDLRNISDELKFLTIDASSGSAIDAKTKNPNPGQLIKTSQDQFRQIMLGCKSQLPSRIDDAFTMLHVSLVHLKECTEAQMKEEEAKEDAAGGGKKLEKANKYIIQEREEIWLTLLALFTDQMTRNWFLIIPRWETAWQGTAEALLQKKRGKKRGSIPAYKVKSYDLIYKYTFEEQTKETKEKPDNSTTSITTSSANSPKPSGDEAKDHPPLNV